jgi:hypothetical protein
VADDLPPDSPELDDALEEDAFDPESYYPAAKSSVIIGILAFFPGVALIFIWYLAASAVLAAAIVGLYRGLSALRHSPRRSRPWMAAIVGVCFCGMDIVVALVAFFAAVKTR